MTMRQLFFFASSMAAAAGGFARLFLERKAVFRSRGGSRGGRLRPWSGRRLLGLRACTGKKADRRGESHQDMNSHRAFSTHSAPWPAANSRILDLSKGPDPRARLPADLLISAVTG